jgi:hypothetical protein
MHERRNPKWWNTEYESAWERVKAAFKRDWDQTKHDFGENEPDTDQDVDDTVKQAVGKQPIPPRGQLTFEEKEDAYRFGYGARRHYGKNWNDEVASQLENDWRAMHGDRAWEKYRDAVRQGWDYNDKPPIRKAA